MSLTLAQTETLKALLNLGREQFHTVHTVVQARILVRPGNHRDHFERHWGLMANRTKEKLAELKAKGLARSGKGSQKEEEPGWMITLRGEKVGKGLR